MKLEAGDEDYEDEMIVEKIMDADDDDGDDVMWMREMCMQETLQHIREQVATSTKRERDEDSERNEGERRKRKKECDKKWLERKNRGGEAKLLKPVPKAVLMKSARKDEVKRRDADRKSRLEALLNELEEQEPKERKTLCLMIQIGIDDIVDIGVDGEIDTIEDLKQKLEDRCKFAIATLYVKITGQWARLCPCDVIKNVIRLDDDLMAVPCESCYRVQTYFVRGLILKL